VQTCALPIWIRDLHRRQSADAHRDHAASHRDQARAVRLSRRRCARPRDAVDLVRAASDHQRAERLARRSRAREAAMIAAAQGVRADAANDAGSRVVRIALIGISLLFLTLILIVPVIAVLGHAFADGLDVYLAAITSPETLSAVRLTLTTAAIGVPINTVFGDRKSVG